MTRRSWGSRPSQPDGEARVRLLTPLRDCVSYDTCLLSQQLDSIHVTVLHKEEGAGLGFSLAGGADLENKVVTVSGPGTGPREGGRSPGRVLCWIPEMQGSRPLRGSWLSGHSHRHLRDPQFGPHHNPS